VSVTDEVEAQDGLDERAIDLGGPVPVVVGHGLEALEAAAFEAPLDAATAFADVAYRKRIKPVHWTISVQNWAIATSKPKVVVDCFDLRSVLPLMFFGVVDVLQLGLQGKSSDIQYVATR